MKMAEAAASDEQQGAHTDNVDSLDKVIIRWPGTMG